MAKYVDSNNLAHYTEKIIEVINNGDEISAAVTVELGSGGTLGGYKTGDTIAAGTPIETVIKKLLAKQIPPTYTAPSVTLTNNGGTAAGNYEIGTTITPRIRAAYTQNHGGDLIELSIIGVASGVTSPLSTEITPFTLTATTRYQASAQYGDGPILNDNLGDPYPTGQIKAGTKTSSYFTYTPFRQGWFWGILDTSSAEEPLTSAIIRSGTKKGSAYSSGSITGIAASRVANRKRIFVACPAEKTGVTKVIMPSAMNADCTADFVKQSTTIMVEGAEGYDAAAYNVWVYEPAAISDDQTFTVTLG